MKYKMIAALLLLSLFACAGPNPNPGERTADVLWAKYEHQQALDIIKPQAEAGIPWAQLRLGVAYELGNGVEQNSSEALKWYKKAAVQVIGLTACWWVPRVRQVISTKIVTQWSPSIKFPEFISWAKETFKRT